jgi:hypothetical protein
MRIRRNLSVWLLPPPLLVVETTEFTDRRRFMLEPDEGMSIAITLS